MIGVPKMKNEILIIGREIADGCIGRIRSVLSANGFERIEQNNQTGGEGEINYLLKAGILTGKQAVESSFKKPFSVRRSKINWRKPKYPELSRTGVIDSTEKQINAIIND
jgi:hypothetical protein